MDTTQTKAFIILHKGKIVVEEYFNGHGPERNWYWASAGKTITATLLGIAQEEGHLNINDKTSDYLGQGWTTMTPEQEDEITIWHQITMTCGFDERGVDTQCTDPECLTYRAEPGTRWYYHNAGYTLTHDVLEAATGQTNNQYTNNKLKDATGMDGFWLKNGFNQVYWSTPRSMARFGWMIANNGTWAGQDVIQDKDYVKAMITPSQAVNESYGYLWWLNGQESHHLPVLTFEIPGPISPDAPMDLYAGLGKNGQFVEVIPSQDLVVVRMGDAPDVSFVPTIYHNEMWKRINKVVCLSTSSTEVNDDDIAYPYPNPAHETLQWEAPSQYSIYDLKGRTILKGQGENADISSLDPGVYILCKDDGNHRFIKR
jgi:CubicO group peptidase (beta-lactamase class C family)